MYLWDKDTYTMTIEGTVRTFLYKSDIFRNYDASQASNGIAEDKEFVKELSKFKGRFEIYLQFDSFEDDIYNIIRGRSLKQLKEQAIDNLKVGSIVLLENGLMKMGWGLNVMSFRLSIHHNHKMYNREWNI